ncbi:hypothetical protein EMCRGX_G026016 [Ephydatia muelleri]
MANFEVILAALLSPDNTTRSQAEEQFGKIPVPVKLPNLVTMLRTHGASDEVRTMAAVLLRRIFLQLEYKDLEEEVDIEVLQGCRAELLMAIQAEEHSSIRKKICDAAAELARSSIDDDNQNHWPEVLQFLLQCCNMAHPRLFQSALYMISVVPGIFGVQLDYCLDTLKQLLVQALSCNDLEVSFEAFKAICSFIVFMESSPVKNRFADVLPLMLQVLHKNLELHSDESLLKSFIDLSEHCPKFLRSQLDTIVDLMLKMMSTVEAEDLWKQLSLEVIVTVAENAPAMMRKQHRFLPKIVTQCLQFMLEVEDDPDWLTADVINEDEDLEGNSITGETSLDRLANALGGRAILPHIISSVPQLLQSMDWHCRHAALMAISAVGEGCEKEMIPILADVVNAILPFCHDQHHRVRYAACNALGQMANDFAPVLQKKQHDKIIPALLMVLDDFQTPRVQAHAGAALVNFCEQCPKSILLDYLEVIVAKLENVFRVKLEELLQKGTKLVLEQIVTTTATVADTVEEHFVTYYDRFMPRLKYIMANAVAKDYRLLRGKTIECISLIGLAVGQEKFMQDAQEVMDLLLKVQMQQGEMDADDPQISYMISAWARMCKIIGSGFVQYLPVVMGPLLQAASIKPEIVILDSADAEQQYSEEDGWEFVTLADQQKFGIKTAGLDDKCTAMQMLTVYAKDLKDGFANYAEQVAKIMVPHLRFYFHELVRAAAAEILPHLLQCVRSKGMVAVRDMWALMADKLLEAIEMEPDAEIRTVMMESLCKCIEFLGSNCFTAEQYTKLAELLKDALDMCFTRANERLARRHDEDYDEMVEEELEEEDEADDETLRKVADVMHSLFSTHGALLLPFFEQLLPVLSGMLVEGRPAAHKQWALCIFDDVLEFASSSAINYQEYFLQPMMKCICDKHAPVRQAACYGIGIMAQCCAKVFSRTCIDALPFLTATIQSPNAREDSAATNATENAISAVAKICKYLESQAPLDNILPMWLSWLPVTEDKEEAPHIYSYLCDLIESNNSAILGANNNNIPRILAIIGEVCAEEVLMGNEQVLMKLLSIARHVQASTEVWNACLQYLNEKQCSALLKALSS